MSIQFSHHLFLNSLSAAELRQWDFVETVLNVIQLDVYYWDQALGKSQWFWGLQCFQNCNEVMFIVLHSTSKLVQNENGKQPCVNFHGFYINNIFNTVRYVKYQPAKHRRKKMNKSLTASDICLWKSHTSKRTLTKVTSSVSVCCPLGA